MKKTIKGIVMITIMAMVIGIANLSNAFSFNANLSSNDKLVAGQEVKVTLSLSNIDMDEGIRSIQVEKIIVGEEFEAISAASFSSSTWMPTYLKGGLILMSGTPVTGGGTAVTLTLKVKPGVTAKSATITFENIVASSDSKTGDISAGTKSITIKANETATSGNGTTTPSSTNTGSTQNGTGNPSGKNTSSTTKNTLTSKTTTPGVLPKAGRNVAEIVLISLMLMVVVIGVVSYIKYKK